MKKQLIAAIAAATMLTSACGGFSAGAFEQWSYAENVSVYVNGNKIDNNEYKPIIANDRTLVRLVPIFEALGYYYQYDEETKSATFGMYNANASYKFTAESNEATIIGTGATSENNDTSYKLDVPATLQYFDVFYVPIRAFCEMVNLDIEWNDATRSVYIGSKPQAEKTLLTYEEAKTIAEKYVNDSDILLGGEGALIAHNGRQAYAFVLRSKSMVENGGSGTMGMTVYVYADNGEIDSKEEVPGTETSNTNNASQINITNNKGDKIGTEYCCMGRIVGKGTLKEFKEGEYDYNQLKAISEAYIENAPDYKTSTGLKPQQALDLINAAYEQSFSGSVDIYSGCIAVHAVKENLVNSDLCEYTVIYFPNGFDQYEGTACYLVNGSTDETFKDTNSTSRILDENYNLIGFAN